MADGPRYGVRYRRRREGRTDYKLRRALVRSGLPRAVVRLSNNYVYVQITEATATGDIVKAAASSKELAEHGWKGATGNLPSAYLTGELAARRALGKGINEAILDIGLKSSTKGSKLYATLKGLTDAGLEIGHSEEPLPKMERIRGQHISEYAKKLSGDQEQYRKRFSAYSKRGLKPEELANNFDQVKNAIMKAPMKQSQQQEEEAPSRMEETEEATAQS